MVHAKKSPYKNKCTFMNIARAKGRKILYRDIMDLFKHHAELEPYDLIFTLNMVTHKIKEKN
ncbi:unnamed protein product [marine sediment metagenome]|uniref:Uncharacterized protein n=1 Tax=marine sediment metagenome TaxID=412755 RepID=X0ZT16_9ZZZZ